MPWEFHSVFLVAEFFCVSAALAMSSVSSCLQIETERQYLPTDLRLVNSFLIGLEGWVALIMPRGDWRILILIWVDGSDLVHCWGVQWKVTHWLWQKDKVSVSSKLTSVIRLIHLLDTLRCPAIFSVYLFLEQRVLKVHEVIKAIPTLKISGALNNTLIILSSEFIICWIGCSNIKVI